MAPDQYVALLRTHARNAPWNARGLAAHVTALVEAAGIRPTNASARAMPTARAVRFYVATGLIDHPEGRGTAATYHYRHLLQLLSVKIRQREGQTLDSIRREMREYSGDTIEKRVAQSLAPALAGGTDQQVLAGSDEPVAWHRIVVADGIEVSVRSDSPAAHDATLVAIREAVRAALGREDVR